jgi:phage shock protein PspC (stress-responsive transcriptional regulator)
MASKRIYRDSQNAMIGGVCAGLAKYLDVDPTLVRLGWVALFLIGGTGLLLYLIAWLIIPEEPVGPTEPPV